MRAMGFPGHMTIGASALIARRALPHVLERPRHVGARRALDADGRIAPGRPAAFEDAGTPFLADPDATGDAAGAVNDEQLAVVTRDDAEPAAPAGRVKDADRDARGAEPAEERARRAANADPVDEHAAGDAAGRRRDQGVREPLADLVGAEDVLLQVHGLPRAADHLAHGVECRLAIAEETDLIAARDIGGGDAPETPGEGRTGASILGYASYRSLRQARSRPGCGGRRRVWIRDRESDG